MNKFYSIEFNLDEDEDPKYNINFNFNSEHLDGKAFYAMKYLSQNKNAKFVLNHFLELVDKDFLINNPDFLPDIVEENEISVDECIKEENWCRFSKICDNISLFNKYYDKIVWEKISQNKNPEAIKFIENNLNKIDDKIDWNYLSRNPSAIKIIENNLDKISWDWLSYNHNAIHLLEANFDNINWTKLTFSNKKGIYLLEEYPYFIDRNELDYNNYAIDLIRENITRIDITSFFEYNHNVESLLVKYHYDTIKTYFYSIYGKELIEWIYKPSNIHKWKKDYWDLDVIDI